MIRWGAFAVGLSVVLWWGLAVTDRHPAVAAASLVCLVAGMAMLLVGREPYPHCCEHCASNRPLRALAAEAELVRAELEALELGDVEATGPLEAVRPIDPN